MSKPTPGKWRYHEYLGEIQCPDGEIARGVAPCDGHLMAASKQMLRELRTTRTLLFRIFTDPVIGPQVRDVFGLSRRLEALNRAIEAAEGRAK